MLKKHIAACMFATALVATPALAQTGAQQPAPAPGAPVTSETAPAPDAMRVPGATAPSTTPGAETSGAEMTAEVMEPGHDLQLQDGFVVSQTAGHHLSSDILGVSVYSADGDSVGSINDLIVDGDERVVAVLIGVGGFLGVGRRDVAIPISEVEFVYQVDATATTGVANGGDFAREISEARIAMTRERIENAPEFARLEAPPMAAPAPAPMPMDAAPRN